MKLSPLTCLMLLVGACLLPARLSSQTEIDAGPEIWVDGPEDKQLGNDRLHPGVGVDELGRTAFVWEVTDATGGAGVDVFLRRFDSDGNSLEDPIFVNTLTEDDQRYPKVAFASDGSFLVVWQSWEPNIAMTADRPYVRSQAFDANGNSVGSEQLLSMLSTERPGDIRADVAALRNRNGTPAGYVVVWESNESNGTDTGVNIQGRLVSAQGVAQGAQFQVNKQVNQAQSDCAVAELPDGGFLVVFEDVPLQLQGLRFDSGGAPVGSQFKISTSYDQAHDNADVALGWNGVVAVVWEDDEEAGDGTEIRARLFDSTLNPLGPDFRVNDLATDGQILPQVADLGPRGFLVTWESDTSNGDDNDGASVQVRIITGPNAFEGPQEQFNIWTNVNQNFPASGGWYGRTGSAWRSNGNATLPGQDNITGRQIGHCLHCDDFEWGSDWRWPTKVE